MALKFIRLKGELLQRGHLKLSGSLLVICFALASMWPPPSAKAQQQIGFIVDMRGKWFLSQEPSRLLTKGQSLPAQGRVSIQSPAEDDYILITDLKGEPIIERHCHTRGQCEGWIKLPAAPEKPGALASAYGAVMNLILGEPDRYSVHRAREGELTDSVVELKGEQVDLREVFNRSEAGKYQLRLRSLARDDQARGQRFGPIAFDWDPAHPSGISVSGLKPGLYELMLLERIDDTYVSTNNTAWILVEPVASFRQTSEDFHTTSQLTDKWKGKATPDASRSFLRARLDQLASRPTQ